MLLLLFYFSENHAALEYAPHGEICHGMLEIVIDEFVVDAMGILLNIMTSPYPNVVN